MKKQDRDEQLRRWLREGDPLTDAAEPTSATRATVVEAARQQAARRESPALRLAAGGLVAATTVFLLLTWIALRVPDTTTMPPHTGEIVTLPTDSQARQVQFTTPGGTRIVWVLDPNFEI
ncbi:MAG: hypothetical protein OES25_11370 [Acidobacteriota bacterium]|nr:hypothetical protein [Acidobacteriota bacterium]